MLFNVLIVCTVTLPPGVNPIAVDKYIYLSIYINISLIQTRAGMCKCIRFDNVKNDPCRVTNTVLLYQRMCKDKGSRVVNRYPVSKSFYFTNGCTIYLFSSTLKFTLKCTLKLLLHVRCSVQSDILHSAPYTFYQGLDITCSHISEQSTTTYFNRLFYGYDFS